LGKDSGDRKGKPGQDSQRDRTAREGQSGKYSQDRKEGTGQLEHDSKDRTDGTEKLGRDNRGRIADSFTALAVTMFSK
jgi:hypothetical protein